MSKETLGFKSRTDAALALQAQGLGPTEIGKRLGISASAVSGLFSSRNRLHEENGEGTAGPKGFTAIIPTRLSLALRAPASRRGISVNQLIVDLLAAVAEDKLVDAVLDDLERRA